MHLFDAPQAVSSAIAVGGVGATEALTRNPTDVRKIAASSGNATGLASPVLVACAGARAGVRAAPLSFTLCRELPSASSWPVLVTYFRALLFS